MNTEKINTSVAINRIEITAATPSNEKDLSKSHQQQQQPQKKAVMVDAISSLATTDGQTSDNLSKIKPILNSLNQDNVSKMHFICIYFNLI